MSPRTRSSYRFATRPVAYLEKLSPEQCRAIEHGLPDGASAPAGGPLLIIAGAGSGKTKRSPIGSRISSSDLLPPRRRRDDAADERICAEALGAKGGVSI